MFDPSIKDTSFTTTTRPPFHSHICSPVRLPAHPSTHTSVHLHAYLPTLPLTHLFTCTPTCPPFHSHICSPVRLPAHPFIRESLHPSPTTDPATNSPNLLLTPPTGPTHRLSIHQTSLLVILLHSSVHPPNISTGHSATFFCPSTKHPNWSFCYIPMTQVHAAVRPSIYPDIHPPTPPSIHPPAHPPIRLSTPTCHPPVRPFIQISTHPRTLPFIHLPTHPSAYPPPPVIHPSVHLSRYPPTHAPFHPPTHPLIHPNPTCHPSVVSPNLHRLVGLVVKASASRAEDPGFESRFRFRGRVIPVTQKLALQWLPCQAPGVIGSALGLVGPVSVYCNWVR